MIGNQLFDSLVDFSTRGHGLFNIVGELFTDLLPNLLNELGLDAREDTEERTLSPFERQPASHFYGVFFDVLMKHLIVEL